MSQEQSIVLTPPGVKPSIGSDVASHLTKLPDIDLISQDWDAVRAYLEQNPGLAPLLLPIVSAVRTEFGSDAELALEVYRDPEIKDEILTLYVRLDVYEADILERLDRAIEPFMEELAQAPGYLLPTTDFRKPRGNHGV